MTIILTTHYIDEAEAIADRIAVIDNGRILLVESKATLMQQMGQKTLTIELTQPTETLPESLAAYNLSLINDGQAIKICLRRNWRKNRNHHFIDLICRKPAWCCAIYIPSKAASKRSLSRCYRMQINELACHKKRFTFSKCTGFFRTLKTEFSITSSVNITVFCRIWRSPRQPDRPD